MNELEQKILDVLGSGNLTLKEIADQLGLSNSALWQSGLNRLIGNGTVEKLRSDTFTVYRVARARDSREEDSFKQIDNKLGEWRKWQH